jgi:hypothetical protein
VICLVDAHLGDIVHMVESCLGEYRSDLVDKIDEIGCLDRLL